VDQPYKPPAKLCGCFVLRWLWKDTTKQVSHHVVCCSGVWRRTRYIQVDWMDRHEEPTSQHCRWSPHSWCIAVQVLLVVCNVIKETIKQKLPNRFSIVFDGWTEGAIHYIGVSATCLDKQDIVQHALLSMRPLLAGDIIGMKAQDYLHHLSNVLRSYGKSDSNIICLVWGNWGALKTIVHSFIVVSGIVCFFLLIECNMNRWIDRWTLVSKEWEIIYTWSKKIEPLSKL
jgi:hypothetical protein